MAQVIYTPWNENFGDQWATVSLMLNMAAYGPVALSRWQNGKDLGPLHLQIASVLDTRVGPSTLRFSSSEEPGNTPLDGYNVWLYTTVPTFKRWSPFE